MSQSLTTQWINQYCNVQLIDRDYNPAKNFLLLWNLFENYIFASRFSIPIAENKINRYIKDDKIKEERINEIFKYFQNRYTKGGAIYSHHFVGLNLRQNDKDKFVEATLLSDSSSLNDKTLTIAIIVYRYRNNLFHGSKNIIYINNQKENLLKAQVFLKLMLEAKAK